MVVIDASLIVQKYTKDFDVTKCKEISESAFSDDGVGPW